MGLGHFVLSFEDVDRARDFYMGTLGFRFTDICLLSGKPWVFTHVNVRHHSLALGPARNRGAFHHVMLEVSDLDTVGRAFDRLETMGVPMATTIGKHTNDEMVSFYVWTPSGFEIEYGYGGRKVDDATWLPVTHDSATVWGHKHFPPNPK
jgi:3,4-dihydroxy-9,10-secoandrosta-1,3,5(10)-triene-9,17-dione 4,5-dioxygenase